MTDSEILKNILDTLISNPGLNIKGVTDLARIIDFHQPNLSKVLAGDRGISVDLMKKLNQHFSISFHYMSNGHGNILEEKKVSDKENNSTFVDEIQKNTNKRHDETTNNNHNVLLEEKNIEIQRLRNQVAQQLDIIKALLPGILEIKKEIQLVNEKLPIRSDRSTNRSK